MNKNKKVNPLTHFNNLKAAAVKRGQTQMANFTKKMRLGGEGEPEETKPPAPKENSTEKKGEGAASATQLGSMSNKEFRQIKKGEKRKQKLERISSGKQGERVDNVIKAVGAGAEAIGNVAGSIKDVKGIFGPPEQKKGGVINRRTTSRPIAKKGGSVKRKRK